MINLITGVPGAGKTAYALNFMKNMTKEGRPLFVHGIPDLKLPHINVYCEALNCDVCSVMTEEEKDKSHRAIDWHEWAPKGAVLFFDEVQNIYRPRSGGSKPPASIQAFEVHRHRGLDFYLISQSPKLFDSNIRELISRHIHLRQNWRGRQQFEWPECKTATQSTADAVKSSYSLNPKIFPLYKSASEHTKQPRKIPMVAIVLAVLVFGGISLVVFAKYSISNSFGLGSESPIEASNKSALHSANAVDVDIPVTPSNFDFKPKLIGVLASAPAYRNIAVVSDFPRIAACISGDNRCTCYTQQMTQYPTTLKQCEAFVSRKSSAFNPFYRAPVKARKKLAKS